MSVSVFTVQYIQNQKYLARGLLHIQQILCINTQIMLLDVLKFITRKNTMMNI